MCEMFQNNGWKNRINCASYVRLSELRDDMKTAKSENGFARCQVHAAQVEGVQNSLKWSRRLVVGAILSLIIKGGWPYISNLFTKRV